MESAPGLHLDAQLWHVDVCLVIGDGQTARSANIQTVRCLFGNLLLCRIQALPAHEVGRSAAVQKELPYCGCTLISIGLG